MQVNKEEYIVGDSKREVSAPLSDSVKEACNRRNKSRKADLKAWVNETRFPRLAGLPMFLVALLNRCISPVRSNPATN